MKPPSAPPDPAPQYLQEPLALVSMACRFPGASNTPSALWDHLLSNTCLSTPVPPSRYTASSFHHPDRSRPGSTPVAGGHFLSDPPGAFDPAFFNIRPAEAAQMDPQHRQILECAWEAFEAAGEAPHGKGVGVYVGRFTRDYSDLQSWEREIKEECKWVGTTETLLANRVSFAFDLKGPSMTVDTACSSSLYALHHAATALAAGECTSALVAASNLLLTPDQTLDIGTSGVLSSTAQCHSFSSLADGYSRGEGIGVLYVKRLCDAIAAGDPIRAVVRATAVNANGRTPGITHPSTVGQVAVMREAYRRAGLAGRERETAVVECHGTGTRVGDPVEVSGISQVFGNSERPVFVGSIKANIGHTEPVSGIAGVIKVTMMLQNGIIPGNAALAAGEPRSELIKWEEWGVQANKDTVEWPADAVTLAGTRRAGINSFGYGGSNAHVVLEEYREGVDYTARPDIITNGMGMGDEPLSPPQSRENSFCHGDSTIEKTNGKRRRSIAELGRFKKARHSVTSTTQTKTRSHYLLPISGHDAAACIRNTSALISVADKYPAADLAYTLSRRMQHAYTTFRVLHTSTSTIAATPAPKRRPATAAKMAFVFTGQGSQYASMGLSLLAYPAFSATLSKLDTFLAVLPTPPSWSFASLISDGTDLTPVGLSQPFTTALQIALVVLLRSWGVTPTVTFGHSSGEIAAAYASGWISAREAIVAAYYRGLAAERADGGGAMLAVGLGVAEAEAEVKGLRAEWEHEEVQLVVACVNSPASVTLAGSAVAVAAMEQRLVAKSVFARALRTGGKAYHSPSMAAVGAWYVSQVTEALKTTGDDDWCEPERVCWVSSVTGTTVTEPPAINYWRQNMESRVQFSLAAEEVLKVYEDAILVELGPHGALAGPLRQIGVPKERYSAALTRGGDAAEGAITLAGTLWTHGIDVNLCAVNLDEGKRVVLEGLPAYSWDHSKEYWSDSRAAREWRFRTQPRHDLLGTRIPGATADPAIWRNVIRLQDLPWLRDHKVGGSVVIPATAYIAMAVEAGAQIIENRNREAMIRRLKDGLQGGGKEWFEVAAYEVTDVKIGKALRIPDDDQKEGVETLLDLRKVRWTNAAISNQRFEWKVASYTQTGGWVEHVTGTLSMRRRGTATTLPAALPTPTGLSRNVDPASLYKRFEALGLAYGPAFAGLSSITTDVPSRTARASTRLRPSTNLQAESRYIVHPATLDTCLQLSLAAGAASDDAAKPYLPVFASQIVVYPDIYNSATAVETASVVAHADSTSRTTLRVNARLHSETGVRVCDIVDFKCSAVDLNVHTADTTATTTTCYPFSKPVWDLDIAHLRPGDLPLTLPHEDDNNAGRWFTALERLTLLCMVQVSEEHPELLRAADGEPEHIMHFKRRIRECVQTAPEEMCERTSRQRLLEIQRLVKELDGQGIMEAKMVVRILEEFEGIVSGAKLTIDVLMRDDLWTKFYVDSLCHRGANRQIHRAIELLSHKNPALKILEIGAGSGGATSIALSALSASDNSAFPKFSKYVFTDLSRGYFPAAQARFESYPHANNIEYEVLDIEKSPLEQGFSGEFDLIIASNVLHATHKLEETLKNARMLLKDGGSLVMLETTREFSMISWVFGSFSGWWLGEGDGRLASGAAAGVGRWDQALRSSGFGGVQLQMPDYPGEWCTNSVMLSTAVEVDAVDTAMVDIVNLTSPAETVPDTPIIILTHEPDTCEVSNALAKVTGGTVYALLTAPIPAPGSTVILTADLTHPLLANVTDADLDAIRRVSSAAASLLWITSAATPPTLDSKRVPEAAMSVGFTRVLREEFPRLSLSLLDISLALEPEAAATAAWNWFETKDQETEAAIDSNGAVWTERIVPDETRPQISEAAPEMQMVKFHSQPALRMDIETLNLFDTIYFKPDPIFATPLASGDVEIKVSAVGMNMKDVVNLMGQVDQHFFSVEAAGIISRVGEGVTSVAVGDRVVCMGEGYYGTYKRVPADLCIRVDDEDKGRLTEMATMPVVFCTVLYALFEVARLKKGESILIHAAAGGVGLAALQVARYIGATVYCTASSPAKHAFLTSLGVPAEHIFNSRNTSFKPAVLAATNGAGVDVVLNSTINELLHESFACLSRFGRHVELGNRDIVDRGRLALAGFDGSRTFSFFYLGDLLEYRPAEVQRLLQQMLHLKRQGIITPITPMRCYDVAQLEQAMRYFTEGKHTGKVVVTYTDPDAAVRFQPPPPEPALKLRSDATYLLLGGLGGLGRSLSERLVARGARSLLFLTPSGGSSAEAQATVQHLRSLGATVTVIRGSSANAADLESAISSAPSQIRGVINAGMVLRDGFMPALTAASFSTVSAPKVVATQAIYSALPRNALDFNITLSSISGVIGFVAQANYAAANTFTDAFAHWQRVSSPAGSCSVNLGMVADVGHVAERAGVQAYLQRWGLYPISESDFLAALESALTHPPAQLVTGFDPARVDSAILSTPRLSHIAAASTFLSTTSKTASRATANDGAAKSLLQQLKDTDDGEKEPMLIAAVKKKFITIMGLADDEVEVGRPLAFYGLDSMVAAEVRAWCWREWRVDVPLLEMMAAGVSVEGLARRVLVGLDTE
ncbi:hypothetical protein EDC01DRAFT_208974 [Geopyxis carbonaria]|nr:hypothetical protein EDC01DRAFT_208974 [Geopyxis carbonaria]